MLSLPDDSDEYIDSLDSDDEYEYDGDAINHELDDVDDGRPNRWHGPPSTWLEMNSEEIDTINAMNGVRNRDLAIHLYNAFALKQRHNRPLNSNIPIPGQVSHQ